MSSQLPPDIILAILTSLLEIQNSTPLDGRWTPVYRPPIYPEARLIFRIRKEYTDFLKPLVFKRLYIHSKGYGAGGGKLKQFKSLQKSWEKYKERTEALDFRFRIVCGPPRDTDQAMWFMEFCQKIIQAASVSATRELTINAMSVLASSILTDSSHWLLNQYESLLLSTSRFTNLTIFQFFINAPSSGSDSLERQVWEATSRLTQLETIAIGFARHRSYGTQPTLRTPEVTLAIGQRLAEMPALKHLHLARLAWPDLSWTTLDWKSALESLTITRCHRFMPTDVWDWAHRFSKTLKRLDIGPPMDRAEVCQVTWDTDNGPEATQRLTRKVPQADGTDFEALEELDICRLGLNVNQLSLISHLSKLVVLRLRYEVLQQAAHSIELFTQPELWPSLRFLILSSLNSDGLANPLRMPKSTMKKLKHRFSNVIIEHPSCPRIEEVILYERLSFFL